jgi:hypothetical protein
LVAAWESAFPDCPIAQQRVVLTVPASFDASARELTREAALAAGLPQDLVLLEEPQAAVYAWLANRGDTWRRSLAVGDTLLVCDVGGGTTDLTLVGVGQEHGELTLQRIAVGNHLLVGGDNMDLTLAHFVAGRFAEKGVKLDPWQSVALWHSCRTAKEVLLANAEAGQSPGVDKYPIAVLGRGSRLIGGTVSIEVDRASVSKLLMDGFFPRCEVGDRPIRAAASGFRELGLPYEADAAVTRHLAAFLQSHGSSPGEPARPTQVLFNGGVFKADALRSRLLDVLGHWFATPGATAGSSSSVAHGGGSTLLDKPAVAPAAAPRVLEGQHDLDHAVARGAAYYGWAKQSGGVRIRGGAARAYYVGIETAGLVVPGMPRPLRALCVAQIGMEEGDETDVPSDEIGLVVGEPAMFRFFSSSVRKADRPGDLLERWTADELEETDSLETALPAIEGCDDYYVPVRFRSRITELGVLELWCVGTKAAGRWKLEFSVRGKEEAGEA